MQYILSMISAGACLFGWYEMKQLDPIQQSLDETKTALVNSFSLAASYKSQVESLQSQMETVQGNLKVAKVELEITKTDLIAEKEAHAKEVQSLLKQTQNAPAIHPQAVVSSPVSTPEPAPIQTPAAHTIPDNVLHDINSLQEQADEWRSKAAATSEKMKTQHWSGMGATTAQNDIKFDLDKAAEIDKQITEIKQQYASN